MTLRAAIELDASTTAALVAVIKLMPSWAAFWGLNAVKAPLRSAFWGQNAVKKGDAVKRGDAAKRGALQAAPVSTVRARHAG